MTRPRAWGKMVTALGERENEPDVDFARTDEISLRCKELMNDRL